VFWGWMEAWGSGAAFSSSKLRRRGAGPDGPRFLRLLFASASSWELVRAETQASSESAIQSYEEIER